MNKKLTLIAIAIAATFSSCKKEMPKEVETFKKPNLQAKGLPGGSSNYLVKDGNNYIGYWGGATLTFAQILYPTNSQQGQLCNGYSVSTNTGEVTVSDGIILLALPSFVGASGDLIGDYQNYANALDVYFLTGGALPLWDNFVSTTYGQTQAMGCFVIVDFNSPSGFSLVSSTFAGVKPPSI
ncbi:hypothetical protein DBR40_05330 [Pedobacter sp. KBW01]|uniref:hypothetical protein n=1 Tax=Pedobacter sp. KBW01 TaxID=2153364 RepID=UPI000F591574|nr:hypothetical protein [Pedobacter sp. KBW01]RQO79143.1 hypothetical protein DBR40_05330 [Pedobacter sp. KBW01]